MSDVVLLDVVGDGGACLTLNRPQALNALKGPLGNLPEFRKKIQTIIGDKAAREKLAAEIGGGKKE